MRRVLPAVSFLLMLAGASCRGRAQTSRAAVEDFFAAVGKRDCAATKKLVAGDLARSLARGGCDAFFDELERHGLRYEGTLGVRPDGRDSRTELVDARLKVEGSARTSVLRVERSGAAWRMARF